jgi:hypothetical protein
MEKPKLSRRHFIAVSGAAAGTTLLSQTSTLQPDLSRKIVKSFTFQRGSAGLLAAFTDYSLQTDGFNFLAEVRSLPKEVDAVSANRKAFFLQANNHSDDIFMYLKGLLSSADGLKPGRIYKLTFDIELASNSRDCVGIGGSEDAVWLKAGGSTLEPVPTLLGDDYVSINIDKGDQMQGGRNLSFVKSIFNGQACEEPARYVLLRFTHTHPFPIRATEFDAQLWFAVGTESGFEGMTGVYYYSITVSAQRVG